MMKIQNHRLLLSLSLLLLTACSGAKQEEPADAGVSTLLPAERNEVTVATLRRQPFSHELVSNGKIAAGGMADLRFESTGIVAHIYVKNGDRARLELQDVLIGQGYAVSDTLRVPEGLTHVPADIMRLARVKSGYDQSLSQYQLAAYEEEHATLSAPFDGVVANLFSKPYNAASTSDAFCTLVGTQGMEADFTVLENELPLIKSGDKVVVTPYADPAAQYEGRISEINPLVDEKGMVRVKAAVNGRGRLFNGMNIRVSVHRSLQGQLVIPKSAVVLRSGKQVVFTLENGKARWNYVHTGLENAESYTLADDGIKEGDTVIVTGNVNLAHEAPVIVKE